MQKIIISGCNGRMGHVVASLCEDDPELSVVAGIDILGRKDDRPFPVYSTAGECREKADAIIDFSNPAALDGPPPSRSPFSVLQTCLWASM